MDEKTAIDVLAQAVVMGQQHGIYSLRDSSLIFQALSILKPEIVEEPKAEEQQEQEKK